MTWALADALLRLGTFVAALAPCALYAFWNDRGRAREQPAQRRYRYRVRSGRRTPPGEPRDGDGG